MENSICILGALKEEIAGFKGRMTINHRLKFGTADVFLGFWEGKSIVLVRTGMGRIKAGGALAQVLDKYSLSMVISIGYAGGCHSDIKAGDLLVANKFLNGPKQDELPKEIKVASCLAGKAEKVRPSNKFATYAGRLMTMDRVVRRPEEKNVLGKAYGAIAVDMETSTLATMAAERNLPFLSVRAISDTVHQELVDVSKLTEDGEISPLKAGWYVLTHPGSIPTFISLQEIARRGTKNITEFLIAFLKLVD
jgi:adenosylhomocysteine nucleosidase